MYFNNNLYYPNFRWSIKFHKYSLPYQSPDTTSVSSKEIFTKLTEQLLNVII